MLTLKDLPCKAMFHMLEQDSLNRMSIKKYKPKQRLIEAGSRKDMDLYMLIQGICFVANEDHTTYSWYSTPYHVHQGDFIGLSELLSPQPVKRERNVIAKTPVTALCIEGSEFLSWQIKYPELYNTIIYNVIQKNFSAKDHLTLFSAFPTDISGAMYLAHLYSIYKNAGYDADYTGPVRIWETHQDIASAIMKNVRSVDRVINSLKNEGLINISNRKIYIDADQAKKLSDYNLYDVIPL